MLKNTETKVENKLELDEIHASNIIELYCMIYEDGYADGYNDALNKNDNKLKKSSPIGF